MGNQLHGTIDVGNKLSDSIAFSGAPHGADPRTFFGNPDQSHARNVVDGLYAVLEHDFGARLQLENTTRGTRYDKYYQNVFPGSAFNPSGTTLTLSAYNPANQRTNVFNQTDLVKKFAICDTEHTLLAGAEVGHQHSKKGAPRNARVTLITAF